MQRTADVSLSDETGSSANENVTMTNEHDQPTEGDELLHSEPIARAINDAINISLG